MMPAFFVHGPPSDTVISLKARGKSEGIEKRILGRVSFGEPIEMGVLALPSGSVPPEDTSWAVGAITEAAASMPSMPTVTTVRSLSHLGQGDIVALHPSGLVETLFRVQSTHNALFLTDRCNSNCLMCSQPPRDIDDITALDAVNHQLVPLIPKDTEALGITGGEPTLLGRRLVGLLELLRDELPQTSIHMLTNGRAFAWKQVARAIARARHPDLVLGIPLYADHASLHDYVVQARDAFAQTILGLHNLSRYSVRVEIRVVLHALTVPRLTQIAEFIFRHFPFAEHIAFMGLEYTGYTPHNGQILWVEPSEFSAQLREAVEYLDTFGMKTSVYNLQHCLLPREIWPFLRPSISAWKREYLPACEGCVVRNECGGVFGTSRRQSACISAVSA